MSNESIEDETEEKTPVDETGADNTSDSTEDNLPPAEIVYPNKLLIIPVMGRPVFPGIFTPLMISGTEDAKAVEEACKTDAFIGIVLMKNETQNPSVADLHDVGTAARIVKKIKLPDGSLNVFISTMRRFRIRKSLSAKSPMAVAVEYLDDENDDSIEVKAMTRALVNEMKAISENNPLFSEEMRMNMLNMEHPGRLADFITTILSIDKNEQQHVLELLDVHKRMEQVMVYVKKEQELLRIQKKIQTDLNEKVEKNQREYFLREELKSIQEELGITKNSKTNDYEKFKEKIDSFKFTGEIKETVESELEKFNLMEPHSPEYISSRNYLELITQLPWQDEQKEEFSLSEAKDILET